MAEGGFRHITVTRADEEDEVIEAGIVGEGDAPASAVLVEGVPLSEGRPEAQPEGHPEGSPEAQPEAKPEAAPRPEGEARQAARPAAVRPPRAADDFHETTLDDLEGEPMSLTQRIVIVAAVVCIIGAIAFYLVFMR